jgi:hypothetical protein
VDGLGELSGAPRAAAELPARLRAHMRHAVSREQLGYPVNMLIVGREDEESLRSRGAYVEHPSGLG